MSKPAHNDPVFRKWLETAGMPTEDFLALTTTKQNALIKAWKGDVDAVTAVGKTGYYRQNPNKIPPPMSGIEQPKPKQQGSTGEGGANQDLIAFLRKKSGGKSAEEVQKAYWALSPAQRKAALADFRSSQPPTTADAAADQVPPINQGSSLQQAIEFLQKMLPAAPPPGEHIGPGGAPINPGFYNGAGLQSWIAQLKQFGLVPPSTKEDGGISTPIIQATGQVMAYMNDNKLSDPTTALVQGAAGGAFASVTPKFRPPLLSVVPDPNLVAGLNKGAMDAFGRELSPAELAHFKQAFRDIERQGYDSHVAASRQAFDESSKYGQPSDMSAIPYETKVNPQDYLVEQEADTPEAMKFRTGRAGLWLIDALRQM